MADGPIVAVTSKTLEDGINNVSLSLSQALAIKPCDSALIMALDGLRSRYTLDQMQINRATIDEADQYQNMIDALSGLTNATSNLKSMQQSVVKSSGVVNRVADALDKVMDAIGVAKSI